MFIHKVISYKNSWELANNQHRTEIDEVLNVLDYFIESSGSKTNAETRESPRDVWDRSLFEKGWELNDRTQYTADGKRINLARMGPTKNGLSASFPMGSLDHISRWVFQQSALAVKHNLIKLPIIFVSTREFERRSERSMMRRQVFEMNADQLDLLSPLSHAYPFLIIGYSDIPLNNPIQITEIETEENIENENSVIDRCIEFPPEYHQAGLDILNFFGTYLREQYPEEQASVKIEQQGLNVRMVIETSDGKSDVIERALHEYELIVTGTEPPEKFAKSDKLVLELRNELRIAQFRMESKNDIIGLQNNSIDKLLNIVGEGLAQKNTVSIDFNPNISVSNNIQLNQSISSALGCLNELQELLPKSSDIGATLTELEGSLKTIEKNNDPESVKTSSALSKFRRVVDKICENGSDLNLAIKKADSGWVIFTDLAKKYNEIADWCGMPHIPSALLK
jgi:hypothetical protein